MRHPGRLEDLRERFKGRLITPSDRAYEAARLVDNGALDRHPAVIAQARDANDVVAAIAFGRASDLPLAVRSGGHSVAGHSTGDGVFVLDLSAMNRMQIDRATRTAWAEPGVRAGQYTSAAYAHGLVTSFGDTGNVGIGGLTLGGGIGWLVRKHGLTIDSLLAVEVVTAAGDQVVASANEHADLFWALRGGGGNFGVATRFRFRLEPIGPVLTGTIVMPATREVLSALVPVALAAPDELTLMPSLMLVPPIDEIPTAHHGSLALFIGLVWAGPSDAGQRALAPIRALAEPLLDDVTEEPYTAVYSDEPRARDPWTCRSVFLPGLDDAMIEIIMRRMSTPTSPSALAQFRILGGASSRVAVDATAYGWRDETLLLWIIADFTGGGPGEMPRHDAWAASFLDELWREGSGSYVNFMADEGPDAVRAAYPGATWDRLREVKRRYDPDNLFRRNQNVPPAPGLHRG